jgi:sugar phosphate isomerase/epimerase
LDEAARMYRGWLDELTMEISSHHCIQPTWALPGDDPAVVREMMRRTAETCALVRPGALVVHPSDALRRPGAATDAFTVFRDVVAEYGTDWVLAQIADNLRCFGDHAAAHGMVVAVENVGKFCPLSSWEWLPDLVARVDHPAVGFCIDSGHAHAFGESVPAWLRAAGDKLFETHFHDNRGRAVALGLPADGLVPSSKELDEHLPIGFGTISWFDVVLALDEIGYAGPVSCETTGWPGVDEVAGVRQAVSWWRTMAEIARDRGPCD